MQKTASVEGQSARKILRRAATHENAILVFILVAIIGVLAAATHGRTVAAQNIVGVLVQSASRGIAAIGQLFVILTSGIDLSVSGTANLAAVLAASILTGQSHIPPLVVPAIVGLGLVVGVFNGVAVSRLAMPALIVTLASWQMTKGGAFIVCSGLTIRYFPDSVSFFGSGVVGGVPVPIIIFIAVAAVAYFVLRYTAFGCSIYAVGGNPTSSWLSGLNVKRIIFSVYVISALLASLAGFVVMARVMSAGMSTVVGLELDSIAAVAIGGVSLAGGRGTVVGVILGVVIIGVINNGMNIFGLDPSYQDIVKGAIIFAAVAADSLRRRGSHD